MNYVGIGNNIINLDQVTHILVEDGGITIFFANMMPVGTFGGSQQPDKVDQLKILGEEAVLLKKYLENDRYVTQLDKASQATKVPQNSEKWETDNNFPMDKIS